MNSELKYVKKVSSIILCWIATVFFVSCSSIQPTDRKNTEIQTGSVNNPIKNSIIPDKNVKLKEVDVQPTTFQTNSNLKGCQPAKVPLSKGLPDNADMNELITKPKTRDEFNEWLSFGSFQLAEIKNKNDLEQYLYEGDFNGDSCQDVAIIVQGLESKTGERNLENFTIDLTVENLRTGAIFQGGDVKKFPFTPKFEAQIKPQQKIALVIVLGIEKGWSWKYGGIGRAFLLFDAIYQTQKTNDIADVSTVFGVIEKNKPEEDDDDLLHLFPPTAKGDCIHTELEIQRKGVEYVDASKRYLFCFDGKNFFTKPLPNTKLYPE